jgi:hypothetical protein
MKALLSDLVDAGRFTRVAPYQRFAYVCGALLLLSGAFHAGVYLVDRGPWEGPVSWRKPVVFGLSFGLSVVTLAWIVGWLRLSRRAGWLVLGVLSVASVGEVFLISLQKWRGVASHFNEATAFDGAVFSVMGTLVFLVGLMTALILIRSLLRIEAPASLALAIRAGLVLMLVSQAVGVQMIVEGGNTFGEAGALKLPHAVTLHAVQVLPALALVLSLSSAPEPWRARIVALSTGGYGLLIASTMVLTYSGRGPLDQGAASAALAIGGLAVLAAAWWLALRRLGPRLRRPPPEAVGMPPHSEHRSDIAHDHTRS